LRLNPKEASFRYDYFPYYVWSWEFKEPSSSSWYHS